MQQVGWLLAMLLVAVYGLYEMGGVWGVTIGAILVVVFFVARAAMRQNRKRRDEEDQDERARLRRSTAQRNLRERIESSRDAALSSYARIPLSLLSAEELLDTAQQEFEEGAFSPFWEAVEAALGKLARVGQDMRIVQNMALSYAEAAHSHEGRKETFPVDLQSVRRLAATDATQKRMRAIVRQAQKNFQFATIYEQRKATRVMIEGFSTLGEALDGLGDRLSASIDILSERVRQLEGGQGARHESLAASLQEIAASEASQRDKIAADQARSADKQLAMLENIQRQRMRSF